MSGLIDFAIIVVCGGLGLAGLAVAVRLMLGDRLEYERNRQRLQRCSWREIFEGRVPTMFEGVRDFRVAAGLAVDRKTNKWVGQGRLSDEAVTSIFRRRGAR